MHEQFTGLKFSCFLILLAVSGFSAAQEPDSNSPANFSSLLRDTNQVLIAISPFQIRLEESTLIFYVPADCDDNGDCRPNVSGEDIAWEARAELTDLLVPASLWKSGYPVETAQLRIACIDEDSEGHDCWTMTDNGDVIQQSWVMMELAMHDERQESMAEAILTAVQALWQ